jgi:hypothetical protein
MSRALGRRSNWRKEQAERKGWHTQFDKRRKIENIGLQKDLQKIYTNAFPKDGTASRFDFVRDPPR